MPKSILKYSSNYFQSTKRALLSASFRIEDVEQDEAFVIMGNIIDSLITHENMPVKATGTFTVWQTNTSGSVQSISIPFTYSDTSMNFNLVFDAIVTTDLSAQVASIESQLISNEPFSDRYGIEVIGNTFMIKAKEYGSQYNATVNDQSVSGGNPDQIFGSFSNITGGL